MPAHMQTRGGLARRLFWQPHHRLGARWHQTSQSPNWLTSGDAEAVWPAMLAMASMVGLMVEMLLLDRFYLGYLVLVLVD